MVTARDVEQLALTLPRSERHLIRDRVKFRVGRLVYLSIAPDELSMGFGFPKEERDALVAAEPAKFFLPRPSDLRFNWLEVWLAELDEEEMRELVLDSWRMVVPKRVAAAYAG
ncbi:MmcQ/YjbR family DNA-binding protein [Plantactinospora siamensis]|uniref:MmcQ/YjbR family DNA-binding protein n=1 Tax=Plantactinospora siamensis TaxID=555372 RepID=A0ABV6P2E6_9ACTN